MSKIGRKVITIEPGVTIKVEDGGDFKYKHVTITGPKGTLTQSMREGVKVNVSDKEISLEVTDDSMESRAFHGLYRSLIANMVTGVTKGYEKKLEIVGVGYRSSQVGEAIELSVGFSHKVKYQPMEGITVSMADENTIVVSGSDKQKVGQVASEIRAIRPPEPYKGKGVRYKGEVVKKKAGKAASAVSGTK